MINYDEIPEPFRVIKVDGMFRPEQKGFFGWKCWGDELYGPADFESFEDAKKFIFRHIEFKREL